MVQIPAMFKIFLFGNQVHPWVNADGTFRFRMVLFADIQDISMAKMFPDQCMRLFHIRAGRINNRKTFVLCLLYNRVTDAMRRKDHNTGINLVQQFQS